MLVEFPKGYLSLAARLEWDINDEEMQMQASNSS
jgi:hypothetical protein